MTFTELPLRGAYQIDLAPRKDGRGEFARLFCMRELSQIGHAKGIAQINRSRTLIRGTVRGMHFQRPPMAEIKMITCVRGRAFDVIVDVRAGSPTFLQWRGVEMSEENHVMMYVPEGFAHGFQTLVDDVELLYFHTEFYTPELEDGLRFDDETLGIAWPLPVSEVSPRDLSFTRMDPECFDGVLL